MNRVYAAKDVDVKTSKDGNKYTVTYTLATDTIYSLSSSIDYDTNAVEFNSCVGADGVDYLLLIF